MAGVADLLPLQLGQEGAGDSEQVTVLWVQAVGDHTVQVELLHGGQWQEVEGRKEGAGGAKRDQVQLEVLTGSDTFLRLTSEKTSEKPVHFWDIVQM